MRKLCPHSPQPLEFCPFRLSAYTKLFLVGSLVTDGCGGDSPTVPPPPPPPPGTVKFTIGPQGGEISGAPGSGLEGARLRISAGVLNQPTTITMSVGDSAALASVLASNAMAGTIVGPVIKLSSEGGVSFPASLTLPYMPGAVGSSSPYSILVFRRKDTGNLAAVGDTSDTESAPSVVNTVEHTVSVPINGFSTFSAVVPRSPIHERAKGVSDVGCVSEPGQLTATVVDDEQVLGLRQRSAPVSLIVLHSTASGPSQTLDDVLVWGYLNDLCSPFACQAHYYIGRAGEVVRLVNEASVAFHARDARMPPLFTNANAVSIGIELLQHETNGTLFDSPPFTEAQYLSLNRLLGGLHERYPTATVDYHKVLDPTRRHDPTSFDTSKLASISPCLSFYASSGSGTNNPPSDLWIVPPTPTGTDNLLGRIRTASGVEPAITDIARATDGSLWGTSSTSLWQIDNKSGQATLFGDYNSFSGANALAFDAAGNLFIANGSGFVGVIAIQQRTLTTLGSFGSGYGSSGDLVFAPDGTLYASALTSANEGILVRVNKTTGIASRVSSSSIGFNNVWGLTFVGSALYGLTADPVTGRGALITINTTTGIGTFMRQLAFSTFGAGAPTP
jgi:hypothetical protein